MSVSSRKDVFTPTLWEGWSSTLCGRQAPLGVSNLQRAFLGEVGAPDEEDGGHHAQKNQGGQVELDEERVTVVGLQPAFRLRLHTAAVSSTHRNGCR